MSFATFMEEANLFLYFQMLILGGVGNVLLLVIIIKNKEFHNTMSMLLFSLSLADTLFLLTSLPIQLYNALGQFGMAFPRWYWCYFYQPLFYFFMNSSTLSLIAITVERYIVICRPFLAKTLLTRKRTAIVIALIWMFSLLLLWPTLDQFRYQSCIWGMLRTTNRPARVIYYFLGFAPIIILIVMNSIIVIKLRRSITAFNRRSNDSQTKARRQLAVMMVVVVVVFLSCLLPRRILFLSQDVVDWMRVAPDSYFVVVSVTRSLFYLNACVNPLIYAIFSTKFRDEFKKYIWYYYRPSSSVRVVKKIRYSKKIPVDEHTV